jgi:hypothetical protein
MFTEGEPTRKQLFVGIKSLAAGLLGVGLGVRLTPEIEKAIQPKEVNVTYVFNFESAPAEEQAETPTPTPTPLPIITTTIIPTETATLTPTATATVLLAPTAVPTKDTRANLCAVDSFIVPDRWWTGRSRNGEKQLQAEDVVRFLNAPPEAPAKDALLKYLKENGMGKFVPINLIPETVRAEDIPPKGAVDVMADLDLKGFMQGLGQILGMDEKDYVDAAQGQLKFENSYLAGLEQMLYRKRITENGQARVVVQANWQAIKVTREMMNACYERWDNSPIALIEGQDQNGSRLIMAFDGYCGNLFLAIKFPPPATPTVAPPTETPERGRTPTPDKKTPTATAVPPQEEIPTPTKDIPTATAVPPQEPVETPALGEEN